MGNEQYLVPNPKDWIYCDMARMSCIARNFSLGSADIEMDQASR